MSGGIVGYCQLTYSSSGSDCVIIANGCPSLMVVQVVVVVEFSKIFTISRQSNQPVVFLVVVAMVVVVMGTYALVVAVVV